MYGHDNTVAIDIIDEPKENIQSKEVSVDIHSYSFDVDNVNEVEFKMESRKETEKDKDDHLGAVLDIEKTRNSDE